MIGFELTGLLAVAFATLVFAGTPGPAVLACLASGSLHGWRRTLAFIGGVVAGDLVYLIAVMAGIATLALRNSHLVYAVSCLGGFYLVVTGALSLRRTPHDGMTSPRARGDTHLRFGDGLLLTASNPKVMLFYFGILPQWFPMHDVSFAYRGILVVLMGGILFGVNIAYACLGQFASATLLSPAHAAVVKRVSGLLIMLIGIYVVVFSIHGLVPE